ncbi:MAG TPA: protein-glutamate O-methyltransferase CheR [Polyangiaceae bacterium]
MHRVSQAEAIETRLLLQAIYEGYGYDFRGYAPESMSRRIEAALVKSGIAHRGELQHRLLWEPEVFAQLLEDLVVPVSELFRDPAFFRAFRSLVVPILKTYPEIKLWHAGCASGEEVYAAAIVLFEEGLLGRTQLYATDLNAKLIEQAREGVYAATQLRAFEQNYRDSGGTARLEDYLVPAYGRVAFKEELRSRIVFFQHSLATDFSLGEMHVIFCRNVLIYFGSELRKRVLEMFAGAVSDGGFLCLGKSESIFAASADFDDFAAGVRIYRRRRR